MCAFKSDKLLWTQKVNIIFSKMSYLDTQSSASSLAPAETLVTSDQIILS